MGWKGGSVGAAFCALACSSSPEYLDTTKPEDAANDAAPDVPETAPPEPVGPSPGDAWRQHGHDASHSSRSTAAASRPPKVLWQATLEESCDFLAPVIDDANRIYASTATKLHALDSSGSTRWTWTSQPLSDEGAFGIAGVAVHVDGTVVLAEHTNMLRGFSPEGDELYAHSLGTSLIAGVSRPVIFSDGTVYVTTNDLDARPMLHAFAQDGHPLFSQMLADIQLFPSEVSEGSDGNLYVSLRDSGDSALSRLAQIHPDGSLGWSKPIGDIAMTPSVATDGSIWLGRWSDGPVNLQRFTVSGEILFANTIGIVSASPAIDLEGNAYVGQPCGFLSMSPTGAKGWSVDCEPPPNWYMHVWSTPAISADGVVVVSDTLGALRGILNGEILWSVQRDTIDMGGALYDSVAIGPDGTLYAGSLGTNQLYALR